MSKRDPSGTLWLRKRFEVDFNKRYRWLNKEMIQHVVKEDALDLSKPLVTLQFAFPRSEDKVTAFSLWLKEMEAQGILTSQRGPGQSHVGYPRWTDVYLESAYKKGMADAYHFGGYSTVTHLPFDEWIVAGFHLPLHVDRAGLIYTRAYNELIGVTDAMDQQMSRVLAQGIADGKNPKVIGRELSKKVKTIGMRRSQLIAHTEVMRAHSEGALNTYDSFGAEGVELQVEWSTANDDRVCPICKAHSTNADGSPKIYTLAEARGLIPLHPDCRCVWIAQTVK